MIVIFFAVALVLWVVLGFYFGLHFAREWHLLDVVSALACLLSAVGPARELKLLPNWAATPMYVVGLFAACGGLCAVLVFIAQRRGKEGPHG